MISCFEGLWVNFTQYKKKCCQNIRGHQICKNFVKDVMNEVNQIPGQVKAPENNTERQYDPFARTDDSESELQKEERAEAEQGSPVAAQIPGSPSTPGGKVETGAYASKDDSESDDPKPGTSQPPEGPSLPEGPEVRPLPNPEPQYPKPEIFRPDIGSPEIEVPFEPQRREDPYDPMIRIGAAQSSLAGEGPHNKGHAENIRQEGDSDGEIRRVFPSIENHDNLEGISDTAGENWGGENLDLDIDNDSNRED